EQNEFHRRKLCAVNPTRANAFHDIFRPLAVVALACRSGGLSADELPRRVTDAPSLSFRFWASAATQPQIPLAETTAPEWWLEKILIRRNAETRLSRAVPSCNPRAGRAEVLEQA